MKTGLFVSVVAFCFMFFSTENLTAKEDELLKVNTKAPDFVTSDFNGNKVSLQKLTENSPIVLVFLRSFS